MKKIDYDVHSYTLNDLLNIFGLSKTSSEFELKTACLEKINKASCIDDEDTKDKLISFLKETEELLLNTVIKENSKYHEQNNS